MVMGYSDNVCIGNNSELAHSVILSIHRVV